MFNAFVITLREGLEAFLIVAIILAYLRRTQRHKLVPAVYWGISAVDRDSVSLPASCWPAPPTPLSGRASLAIVAAVARLLDDRPHVAGLEDISSKDIEGQTRGPPRHARRRRGLLWASSGSRF